MNTILNLPMFSSDLEVVQVDLSQSYSFRFFESTLSAGFPSPAEDYSIASIDIGSYITSNPISTFFVRVNGDSLIDAHIPDGSLLAIDKSLTPKSGDLIVAVVNNEFTAKRLIIKGKQVILQPENKNYKPILVTEDMNFQVWGKVVAVIHKA